MSADVLWSAEQHALIGAMGLSVYAHVDLQPWPAPVAVPAFENLPPASVPGRSSSVASDAGTAPRPDAVAPRRAPPVDTPFAERPVSPSPRQAPVPPVTTASEKPARPRRGGLLAAMPDRLMLALLRASGLNPADPSTQERMAGWPLDTLRSDPSAKRALWQQLRRLRKQRQAR